MFCVDCGKNDLSASAVMCPACGAPTAKTIDAEISTTALALGWISAVVVPIVGIIAGIIVAVRGKVGTGIAMIGTSILFWVVWTTIILNG